MPARVIAGILAAVWSLLVLPPQVTAWSGDDGPGWVSALASWSGYDAVRDALGLRDAYPVFGIAIAPAMLLALWALLPALRRFGRAGVVLVALWIAWPVLTVLGYLNAHDDAPLRFLWGVDAIPLVAIPVAALVAAVLARHDDDIPLSVRLLVGATLLFAAGGTLLGGYWPHATMMGLGVHAALVAAWRPRVTPSA